MSWIINEISARGGEVPFDAYMELALYHPEHGYYCGEKPPYGRDGDYLTAPTASKWYARVLARVLSQIVSSTGPIRLIDVASGDGALIAGVIECLGERTIDVLDEVISVERSAAMRGLQRERLRAAPIAMRWIAGVSQIRMSSMPTAIHASELYDALPVARAIGGPTTAEELVVGVGSDGELEWRRRPARNEVIEYFARHGVVLEGGQVAEANLCAEKLHRELLGAVGNDGLCLVLDYGYEAHRLYDSRGRRGGSLATFRRHEFGRDPLTSPGTLDLTAHVNWDDLRDAADGAGWRELGLWPLAVFMVRAGIADELDTWGLGVDAELDSTTVAARQEVKRLLDPEGMGSDLKMLVQGKGSMVGIVQSVLSVEL